MSLRDDPELEFLARQAVYLHRQGLDASTVEARLVTAFDARQVQGWRMALDPPLGSLREALSGLADRLGLPDDVLAMHAIDLEQLVRDCHAGIWRGLLGLAAYTGVLAVAATVMYAMLVHTVVPNLELLVMDGHEPSTLATVVFRYGGGVVLLAGLWGVATWLTVGILAARRAVLLEAWSRYADRVGLLRSVLRRHRSFLRAWTSQMLIDEGIEPGRAIDEAVGLVARWSGDGGAIGKAESGRDTKALATAAALGTLREELDHRITHHLADAPLAIAGLRDQLGLLVSVTAAALIVPMLVAMYALLFASASQV